MKQFYFISKSVLAQNLVQLILSLTDIKMTLQVNDDVSHAVSISHTGKKIDLVIVDYNCLKETSSLNNDLNQLHQHPRFSESTKYLIYPHGQKILEDEFVKHGFSGFYCKPFLTDELAQIIGQGVRQENETS